MLEPRKREQIMPLSVALISTMSKDGVRSLVEHYPDSKTL